MKHCAIIMPIAHQRGGAEAMLMHLLRENADRQMLDLSLVFLEDGPMVGHAESLGYTVTIINAGRLSQLHNYVGTMWRLRRALRRQHCDAVLSWMSKAQLYMGPASLGLGIPVFWFQHGITGGGWMDRLSAALPTAGIFACSSVAAHAQQKISQQRSVAVCSPAVDLAHLENARLQGQTHWRTLLDLPAQASIVGMVARMERWKGIDVFIKMVAQLAPHYPNLHAFVVGGAHPLDPDCARELQAQAEQSGLGGRLRLVGQRPLEEVAGWWCACDIAVHPVTGAEPFGMGIVEAMAMGKPVIASALGGPAEIIQDQVNGLLCAPGDVDGLVRAAQRVLDDPELRRSLGQAARVRALGFSPQRLLQCLVSHFSGEAWETSR
ncbi:MAG: glycosyltransferase family 4 protein [Planctomycetia bacterium]|nr:glycosyltransferase family 4 protein [Planctomycetia bacterium]